MTEKGDGDREWGAGGGGGRCQRRETMTEWGVEGVTEKGDDDREWEAGGGGGGGEMSEKGDDDREWGAGGGRCQRRETMTEWGVEGVTEKGDDDREWEAGGGGGGGDVREGRR